MTTAWVEGLLLAAIHLGLTPSRERALSAATWTKSQRPDATVRAIAESCGLSARQFKGKASKLRQHHLPALALTTDGACCLITKLTPQGAEICGMSDGESFEDIASLATLDEFLVAPLWCLKRAKPRQDKRVEDYYPRATVGWFRATVFEAKGPLFELGLASFFSSLLAIATAIFSMQVWDRVIPARSMDTLWVLTIGVALALLLDFGLRSVRVAITDHYGKRADTRLSAMMFSRMLDISSDARPKNPGTLVAQLRDLDQLRELMTSSTLGVLMDLPFAIVFLFIIWFLGGWMVLVPLAAIPLVLLPGLFAQIPLARLSREGMAEAALRNSVLMETIFRIDDIKLLQAERRFADLWTSTNDVSAAIALKQRFYRAFLLNWSQTVQQAAFAATLVAGAYAVISGNLSFGVLTACSMLTGRAIAPLSQVATVLSVLQNARMGKKGLDGLVALPTDHDTEKSHYSRPDAKGAFQLENMVFTYDGQERPALVVPNLTVKPGDRIALLGRAGSGKSTLLRLLAGLSKPGNGRILFDNSNLDLIDPADLRRAVGVLMQDSGLFHGTIRDNLALASPRASDADMLAAMKVACADELLLKQQHGLDLMIRENGLGLSGGQRQVLLLARTLLRNPKILLLDEPTAALDEATERKIVANLMAWAGNRTIIVATHRYPILDLVQRVVVLDGGRIAADGPRDQVIAKLRAA